MNIKIEMMKKRNNIYKTIRAGLLLVLFVVFSIGSVWAEGSKDLYPSGASGGRAYLRASTTPSLAYPFPTLGTHYVYAEAGERIALATSEQNSAAKRIFLYSPDGVEVTPTGTASPNGTRGNISNRAAELAGPRLPEQSTGGNRYLPVYYEVPVGGDGIYKVEFRGNSGSETGDERYGYSSANSWPTTDSNKTYNYLKAWDISVAKQTGNMWSWQTGRVYTTVLNMDNPSYGGDTGNDNNNFRPNSGFYGKFKVLTRDGYVYDVNNNGNQGISFTFMVNNRGFHKIGDPNTPSYQSIAAETAKAVQDRYHDPRSADSASAVTQKIFYNLPDGNMPEEAKGGIVSENNNNTWLRVPEKDLNVSDLTVKGVEGSNMQIGNKGAFIEFTNESGGDYYITIRPKLDSTTDFPEKQLTGPSAIGENKIYWDGTDGNDDVLPSGLSDVEIELKLRGAEVHFPYVDMELNANGIVLQLYDTELKSFKSDIVYWDDTNIRTITTSTHGSMSSPRDASHTAIPDGTSSSTNGHKWGGTSMRTTGTFGDEQGMDTWTFIEGESMTATFEVDVKIADLSVKVDSETSFLRVNESITYSVTAENIKNEEEGYISDVTGAPFSLTVPAGFILEGDPVVVENSCGIQAELEYDEETRTYTSNLDLPNGCKIVYSFTAKVTEASDPDNLDVIATIMRPMDVYDPDATNISTAEGDKTIGTDLNEPNFEDHYYPPTDPFFEVDYNGKDGISNNIDKKTIQFFDFCVDGCNDNSFFNSSLYDDPNSIEYDNLVSTFHSSIAKEQDGQFKIWGEGAAANGTDHLYSLTAITNVNGFSYEGTPLKATAGSKSNSGRQFVFLTTEGLYVWGSEGYLISSDLTTKTVFDKLTVNGKEDGLPEGVSPLNVKMMFGSYRTLAIVTCDGDAWVLSSHGSKNGDGTTQGSDDNNKVWHRVKTDENTYLNNVVAMRGTPNALFALTAEGKLYTWGTGTYINTSTGATNRTYATEVSKPVGVTPKMIGMTQNLSNDRYSQTYYLLATDGKLFAMGNNTQRQLGDKSTTSSNIWKEVTAIQTINNTTYNLGGNIAWISPNEHDDYGQAAINVITNDKKQWAWGSNNGQMIGGANGAGNYDPMYMPGIGNINSGLSIDDNIVAIETGGHTTVNIKECSNYFGYVGHKVNGSMADGTNDTGNPNTYSYATAILVVCGTEVGTPKVRDLKICEELVTADLNDALRDVDDAQFIVWRVSDNKDATPVSNPSAVEPGTYYAFFVGGNTAFCEHESSAVTVSYLVEGESGFGDCDDGLCYVDIMGNDFMWANEEEAEGEWYFFNQSGFEYETLNPYQYWGNGDVGDAEEGSPLEIYRQTITQPGTTGGFVFDIYAMDNSFNMEINGKMLATNELQFQFDTNDQLPGNIKFKDDTYHGSIWRLYGDKETNRPIIRVVIDKNGNPSVFASKVSYDHADYKLEEMVLTGIEFNTVEWNGNEDNEIIVRQLIAQSTMMVGYGYGRNIVDCEIFAIEDINQTPKNKSVTGNVLTNDIWNTKGGKPKVTTITIDGTPYSLPIDGSTSDDLEIPGVGTISIANDGKYTFNPDQDYVGTFDIQYSIEDEAGEKDSSNLTIKVIPNYDPNTNNPVIAHDDAFTTAIGVPVTSNILINDSDPGLINHRLIVDKVTIGGIDVVFDTDVQVSGQDLDGGAVPNAGTIKISAHGEVVFTPAEGFIGTVDPINYKMKTDETVVERSDYANIYITVLPNDANSNHTFAYDDTNSAPRGVTMTGNVLDNDFEPDSGQTQTLTSITIEGVEYPILPEGAEGFAPIEIEGKGSLTMYPDGRYSFIPTPYFVGTLVVEQTVCDDGKPQDCDNATLYLTLLPYERRIYAIHDINQTPKNIPISGNVLTNDLGLFGAEDTSELSVYSLTVYSSGGNPNTFYLPNEDEDPLNVDVPFDPPFVDYEPYGDITIYRDGSYTFTPTDGYVGEFYVMYTIKDNEGHFDNSSLTIEVIDDYYKHIAPVAQYDGLHILQGEELKTNILKNDSDPADVSGQSLKIKDITYGGLDVEFDDAFTVKGIDLNGNRVDAGSVTISNDGKVYVEPFATFAGIMDDIDYTINKDIDGDDTINAKSSKITITVISTVDSENINSIYTHDDAKVAPRYVNMSGNVFDNDSKIDDNVPTLSSVRIDGGDTVHDLPDESDAEIVVEGKGKLTINSDGEYIFVPYKEFVGTVVVEQKVIDGSEHFSKATLYLTVLESPNTTFAVDDFFEALNNTLLDGSDINVIHNDIDPEDDTQKVTMIRIEEDGYETLLTSIIDPDNSDNSKFETSNGGTVRISEDGKFTYMPPTDKQGFIDYFWYKICDDPSGDRDGIEPFCDWAKVEIAVGICTEAVEGSLFGWTYAEGIETDGTIIDKELHQKDANYGFVFDIYKLDNSFNMKVNGIKLAKEEIQFQNTAGLVQNIRFKDGSYWNDGTVDHIWNLYSEKIKDLPGDFNSNPTEFLKELALNETDVIIRVVIGPTGKISMYGRKKMGSPLQPLELFNNEFNDINWHPEVGENNEIFATQLVQGATLMIGEGYGTNRIDCPNYWYGNDDTDWDKISNWTDNYVPATKKNIEFATVENNSGVVLGMSGPGAGMGAAKKDLYVPKGETKEIKDLINKTINSDDESLKKQSLVIPPTSELNIYGVATDSNTDPDKIVVKASESEATGTLYFPNDVNNSGNPDKNNGVQATVEFYNQAYDCANCGYFTRSWQYFGIPVQSADFPYIPNEDLVLETIYQWDEPTNGNKWIVPETPLEAFKGYEITNSSTTEPNNIYAFKGKLNVGNAKVIITKTGNVNYSGMNLIANSFTAAIPISREAIVFADNSLGLDDRTAAVYLFNTGTRDQWRKLNGGSQPGVVGGTYISVPLELGGQANLPNSIPSMHSFMVESANSNTDIELVYSELVRNEVKDGQPAWRSAEQNNKQEIPLIVLDVIGTQSADRVWLFEQAGTTRGFDNGWDGIKMPEKDIVQLYVAGEEGTNENYQVATVPQLVGTSFGMKPEVNESYTLSMAVSQDVEARGLYLRDMLTGRSYALKDGGEYRVSGSLSSDNRFKVVDNMLDESKLGGNPLIDIYTQNNQVVVANNSDEDCTVSLYDVAGKLVAKQSVARNSTTYINGRVGGAYVVKVVGSQNVQESKRVIVGSRGQ